MEKGKEKGMQTASSLSSPTIIGIYGIKGCGKSFLLKQLQGLLDPEQFLFVEGSEAISDIVSGGYEAFEDLPPAQKHTATRRAINSIASRCLKEKKTAIVTGHFSIWDSSKREIERVITVDDLEKYSHILYLDTPENLTRERTLHDKAQTREDIPAEDLEKWKEIEIIDLRKLSIRHHVLFGLIHTNTSAAQIAAIIEGLVRDKRTHFAGLQEKLDEIMKTPEFENTTKVLVFSADKSLTPDDTGTLFWKRAKSTFCWEGDPMEPYFRLWGYSYDAFQQVSLLYEGMAGMKNCDALCSQVAGSVELHRQIGVLLHLVNQSEFVSVVIITCGLAQIWRQVLDKRGLSKRVAVIGVDRVSKGFVVTPKAKEKLVLHLKNKHRLRVWAFGGGLLDTDMLRQADEAIMILGEEVTRSKFMDFELIRCMKQYGFQASQAILPHFVSCRLAHESLPLLNLTSRYFLLPIFMRPGALELTVSEDSESIVAQLLTTTTRDCDTTGPSLWEAHRKIGRYLAVGLLAELLGLEEYAIPHVQGKQTKGFRIACQGDVLIVGILTGLFLAEGVRERMPQSTFHLAYESCEINTEHVHGIKTVILVDSEIDSGTRLLDFIDRINELDASIRIIIVAGVVQRDFIEVVPLEAPLKAVCKVELVALYISDDHGDTGENGAPTPVSGCLTPPKGTDVPSSPMTAP